MNPGVAVLLGCFLLIIGLIAIFSHLDNANPRDHRLRIWSDTYWKYDCKCRCSPPQKARVWHVQGTWEAGVGRFTSTFQTRVRGATYGSDSSYEECKAIAQKMWDNRFKAKAGSSYSDWWDGM